MKRVDGAVALRCALFNLASRHPPAISSTQSSNIQLQHLLHRRRRVRGVAAEGDLHISSPVCTRLHPRMWDVGRGEVGSDFKAAFQPGGRRESTEIDHCKTGTQNSVSFATCLFPTTGCGPGCFLTSKRAASISDFGCELRSHCQNNKSVDYRREG